MLKKLSLCNQEMFQKSDKTIENLENSTKGRTLLKVLTRLKAQPINQIVNTI